MKLHTPGGWLLYSGDLGSISARVTDSDISVRTSTIDVTSIFSTHHQAISGPTYITLRAELSEKDFRWDKTPGNPEPPWDIRVLLDLARRHPGEYAELAEGEAVLRALGG